MIIIIIIFCLLKFSLTIESRSFICANVKRPIHLTLVLYAIMFLYIMCVCPLEKSQQLHYTLTERKTKSTNKGFIYIISYYFVFIILDLISFFFFFQGGGGGIYPFILFALPVLVKLSNEIFELPCSFSSWYFKYLSSPIKFLSLLQALLFGINACCESLIYISKFSLTRFPWFYLAV